MKLLRGMQQIQHFKHGVVATVGNFDGVHLGHQHILNLLKQRANELKLPSMVILFEPQPQEYFHKLKAPKRLYGLREKVLKLKEQRIDLVYCIVFNRFFAELDSRKFAEDYLFSLYNVKHLIIGEDFRFGKERTGDSCLLKGLSTYFKCKVEVLSDFCINQTRISSTAIRQALEQGLLKNAEVLLGRPYSISGRVIYGNQRGRQWGIPTANISLRGLITAITGVFVVRVNYHQQSLFGVANVGTRPTVDGLHSILEVHLFDFNQSIYGERLQVIFLHKLRDEVKFTFLESLITQIRHDIMAAKDFVKQLTILQSGE